MSQIILPSPAKENRPLACFDFLGMFNVGSISLSLNRIESAALWDDPDRLLIKMIGGDVHKFEGELAKEFLARLNELSEAVALQVRQQQQPQLYQVPPGTRIAHH